MAAIVILLGFLLADLGTTGNFPSSLDLIDCVSDVHVHVHICACLVCYLIFLSQST